MLSQSLPLRPDELQSLRAMRGFFRDIVLVVSYRHRATLSHTLDLVQTIYGPIFQQVLAVAREANTELGVYKVGAGG